MKTHKVWQQAQSEELNCWVQISHKLDSALYIQRKKAYWRRILSKAGLTLADVAAQSVIEVGAGPSGIFLLFPGKTDFITLDPLNDQYKRLAPHLYHQQTIITTPLEKYRPKRTFEIVFAINCIDHSDDIDLFVEKLAALCAVGGTAVLAVNCHQNKWSEWIWQRFQATLEPHHPYHFTVDNYVKLLSSQFNIVGMEDIEADVIWINNETNDAKIPPPADTAIASQTSRFGKLWQAIVSGRAVAVLFMRFLALLGWPAHDFTGNGRSLYRHKLFILKPKSTA